MCQFIIWERTPQKWVVGKEFMARNAIFITGFKKGEKIADDYWYSYQEEDEKGILRVYKHEQLLFEGEANIGDGFEVVVKNGKNKSTFVAAITLPKKPEELVARLLGFDKREIAHSYEEYADLLEQRRGICNAPGYVEEIIAGPNYEYAKYSLIYEEGYAYHSLACWVDSTITQREILHLIPRFVSPEVYVRKVLHEKLGISIEELDKAFSM